jgi:hypothetical protein
MAGGEGPGGCVMGVAQPTQRDNTSAAHTADAVYIELDECPVSGWSNLTRPDELEPQPHDP